jgi:hypothetical protein
VTTKTCKCEKENQPLRIKNDLKALVEDSRAVDASLASSPPRAARRSGQPGEKPTSLLQKLFDLIFGMCKSQHVTDVRAKYDRRVQKKDTRSVKEVHAHLNLQPSRSPIASKVEESPKIESFADRVDRFEVENPMQHWYGDTSFSREANPSYSQPPLFDSPPKLVNKMRKW